MSETEIIQFIQQCSEIDEYRLKIILSKHSMKAQTYIVNKIYNHIELQKQVCDSLKKTNSLLETEIKLDGQNRKSLLSTIETMKTANMELKKQLLLAEHNKQSIINRKNNNIKKYENKWLKAKQRLETVPFVQRYLQLNNKIEIIRENIMTFIKDIKKLNVNINIKRRELLNLDNNYVVELSEYLIHKRPIIIKEIKKKEIELKTLRKATKIKEYLPDPLKYSSSKTAPIDVPLKDTWTNLSEYLDDTIVKNIEVPFKRTSNLDIELASNIGIKKTRYEEQNIDIYVSSYLTTSECSYEPETYSNMKLINILEDIKLDTVKTCSIISNLKPDELQQVNLIKAGNAENNLTLEERVNKVTESEGIRLNNSQNIVEQQVNLMKAGNAENNLTLEERVHKVMQSEEIGLNNSQDILAPPSQFLDLTQNSQEKQVTLCEVICIRNANDLVLTSNNLNFENDNNTALEIFENQLNMSVATDDGCVNITEKTGSKNHKLNPLQELKNTKKRILQTVNNDENIKKYVDVDSFQGVGENTIKSKYFNKINVCHDEDCNNDNIINKITVCNVGPEQEIQVNASDSILCAGQKDIEKENTTISQSFLGNCLPSTSNYLSVSLNTTGYEDFPQCLDSNVLLSPKGIDDDQLSSKGNEIEISSQEVPNFLTGLKKTCFSFFGATSTENEADTNMQSYNNFNFNFDSDERGKRSGLFNIFQ